MDFCSGSPIHASAKRCAPVSAGYFAQKDPFLKSFAYRDCTVNNIMFDPSRMYPKGYHPSQINRSRDFKGRAKRYTRTDRPPRYYLIDFGLSRRYSSRNVVDEPLRGGDRTAPEHRRGGRCNPFPTDIYYLGNLVREQFSMVRQTYPHLFARLTEHCRSATASSSCKS
jgi:hypothetical protein